MRVQGKRGLAWLLAMALCCSLLPGTAVAAEGDTYVMVTDAADLAVGDQIIIAAAGYDQAMGAQSGNYRVEAAVTKDAGTNSITLAADSGVSVLTLTEVATEGAFGLQAGDKFLNGVSGSNYLKEAADTTDTTAHWTITIDETTGATKIVSVGAVKSTTNAHYEIQYNSNSGQTRFSCYTGTQKAVAIYKLQTGDVGPITPTTARPTAAVNGAALTSGNNLVKGDSAPTVTLTAEEGAEIYYATGDAADPSYDTATSTATGTLYESAISLADGANTIRAIAVKDGVASTMSTFTYTVLTKTTPGAAHSGTNNTAYAVEGILTVQSGKSLYLETADGGAVCVYLKDYPSDAPTPGTTILAVGTREVNRNQPRLRDGAYTVTNATPTELPCTTATLAEVLDANHDPDLLSRRVKISGLTLGTYDTNNTPVSDGQNNINIYKCPTLPTDVHAFDEGTTVNVTAVVGCYNARQLLVGAAADVEWVADPTVVADIESSVATGGTVAPGQSVTFTTATEGAAIQHKVGDAADWTDGSSYTVPEGTADGTAISIQVQATKAGMTAATATFAYTVKAGAVGKYAKLATAVNDRDQVVLYHDAGGMMLTATANGKKLNGTEAAPQRGFVQVTDAMAVLTAHKNADGQYTFQTDDGKYLTSAATGNGLSFAAAPGTGETDYSLWTLAAATGGFSVKNVNAAYSGKAQALEYYSGFTTYSFKTGNDAYIFNFYAVTDEVPLPIVEAPAIAPEELTTANNSVQVTITCATEGAEIHYTTDGSEPTAASTKYTAPFDLDVSGGTGTVKAIAVKTGMDASDVASKTYQKVAADQEFVPVLTADELKAGGYFVIVPKEFPTQALSTSFAFKPSPVTVSNPPANGEYAPTLKLAPEGDGVSIQYEATGKYIGYDKNYSTSIQESDTPYAFTVSGPNADGAFRFVFSTATNRAIALQANTSNIFGAYAAGNDGKTTTNTDKTITYGPYECDMLVYKSTKGYLYNPHITFGVLNDATVGQDWSTTYAFEETDVVSGLAAQYSLDNATWTAATLDETAKTVTVPGAAITAGATTLYLKITGTDTRGEVVKEMVTTAKTAIKDEPMITAVSPDQGAETGENKKPTFSVTVVNGGEFTAKISITPKSGDPIVDADMSVDTTTGVATYTPAADLAEGWCEVSVTVTRGTGETAKTVTKSWSCTVGVARYKNYFGQLHSHTAEYSDGAGTLASALEYIKNTAMSNNVQFVAFTDHSNYFDTTSAAAPADALYDTSLLPEEAKTKWDAYKSTVAAFNAANAGSQVAIAGFEMTWSGGPGHINTFNTPGIVSRNNKDLNNKTNDAGMKAYYSLLSNDKGADSISQFNHPGTTFGTFSEFAYYDPVIDSRITLVEVGNGEGAIGSGGYFPSYSEYIKALDKGWHLAPTNNQDNHKGHWGDSNDARTVVYTTDLSENGIYQAMREMRIYATEDKNLDVVYTVNGRKLGTIISEVPASAKFQATISDPDAADQIGKVEIVTNGGSVVHKVENITEGTYTLDWEMAAPKAGYYFLRITQADGDIAVTAPVWLGQAKNVGMSELVCSAAVVVKDEAVTLSNQFFNNESAAATLKSVTYTLGDATIGTEAPNAAIPSMGTLDRSFTYTFAAAGKQTVTLTAVVEVGGETKTLTSSITLDVKDPDNMIFVGVDGSHYNEYVSGNYKDTMGNFTALAADYDVRVVVLNTKAELLAALANPKYKMMVFTAPSRRNGIELRDPYANYAEDELAAIATFAQGGGTLVLTGWGDYYEHYAAFPAADHMAAQQNAILAAVGSKLRLADDEAKDDVNKPGNNAARLYLTDYNGFKSPFLAGVDPAQVWSQYGGCTLYAVDDAGAPATVLPESVTPMVSGFGKYESDGTGIDLDKIDSHDEDKDGYMPGVADATVKPPKYPSDKGTTCLLTATEELTHANGTKSLVVVSGGAFMSDFEVKFDLDNVTQLGYSNPVVLGNLLESLDPTPVTQIKDLPAAPVDGTEYVVEGVITANTSGYDRDTAFFDCTYVQDATGGINVFPVSGNFQVGQRVRVKGIITSYQGERELTLSTSDYQSGSIKALSHAPDLTEVTPAEVSAKSVAQGEQTGRLVKVQGTVLSFSEDEGAIANILVQDTTGVVRVFIDGYITADKDAALREVVKEGAPIVAVGIASYDESYPDAAYYNRIRIRDRADITAGESAGGSHRPSRPVASSTGYKVKPGDVTDQGEQVKVELHNGRYDIFLDDTKDKLVTLNETKPVVMEGGSLKVLVPVGTITPGMDPADLLVGPFAKGNAVQVTLADGTTQIVPFALVTEDRAAYIADKVGEYTLVDNTKTFVDVPETFWGADAVDFVSTNEIFSGVGGDRFAPEGQMTRAMLVTVLARLSGAEVDGSAAPFADVPAGEWYTGAVAWAAQAGIVQGNGTGFDPEAPVTREALCVILQRFAAYRDLTLNEVAAADGFADADAVSDWAQAGVDAALKTGLITGKPGKVIDPAADASRAEVAAVLQRLIESVLG